MEVNNTRHQQQWAAKNERRREGREGEKKRKEVERGAGEREKEEKTINSRETSMEEQCARKMASVTMNGILSGFRLDGMKVGIKPLTIPQSHFQLEVSLNGKVPQHIPFHLLWVSSKILIFAESF